ncbi:MAG: hypothetical protein ACI8RW_000876, partial [Porticoccaceae bacterium]
MCILNYLTGKMPQKASRYSGRTSAILMLIKMT